MLTPVPVPYADQPAQLAALQAQGSAYFLAHASRPDVESGLDAYLKSWAAAYEVRNAQAEQNPVFAATLLPAAGLVGVVGIGIPLFPAGVRWAVDEDQPGTVTVTLDVAGPVGLSVQPPHSTQLLHPLVDTSAGTRASATFAAPADGLYAVHLVASGVPLATLYVPVLRAEWRLLREECRALRYQFRAGTPRPGRPLLARLARLAGLEAAARTGQPALAQALLASVRALPAPATPIALYPTPRHAR